MDIKKLFAFAYSLYNLSNVGFAAQNRPLSIKINETDASLDNSTELVLDANDTNLIYGIPEYSNLKTLQIEIAEEEIKKKSEIIEPKKDKFNLNNILDNFSILDFPRDINVLKNEIEDIANNFDQLLNSPHKISAFTNPFYYSTMVVIQLYNNAGLSNNLDMSVTLQAYQSYLKNNIGIGKNPLLNFDKLANAFIQLTEYLISAVNDHTPRKINANVSWQNSARAFFMKVCLLSVTQHLILKSAQGTGTGARTELKLYVNSLNSYVLETDINKQLTTADKEINHFHQAFFKLIETQYLTGKSYYDPDDGREIDSELRHLSAESTTSLAQYILKGKNTIFENTSRNVKPFFQEFLQSLVLNLSHDPKLAEQLNDFKFSLRDAPPVKQQQQFAQRQ